MSDFRIKCNFFDNIQILCKTIHLLIQTLPLLFYGFSFAIIVASLMRIKRDKMKKIILAFLNVVIMLSAANAQNGINFYRSYAAGGRLAMFVDSAAKNVYYGNIFPNQPQTSFNYLPEVNNVSVQIYFVKTDRVQDYRYTILADNKPIAVNKLIDTARLKNADRGEGEIRLSATLGSFSIKDKIITILTYDIQTPQDVYKNVFYGRPIPKAKIKTLAKRFASKKGVDYSYITDPKERTSIIFTRRDDELTIVKDRSDIDYLYYTSIKDKHTNKVIFESTAWQYGGYLDEAYKLSPYINIDKSIFKKSGDYEIIIQPLIKWDRCLDCDISSEEIEKYVTRHTLSITIDEESYTKLELFTYAAIVTFCIGFVFLVILYLTKKRNKKKLAEKEQEGNMIRLQLNTIRSQLNPHFLFNALSGIQNLINKNEIDSANKYLSKFARLTRNVLKDNERISLLQEKSLLDDYLQMEQMRFGFQYTINHSGDLDLTNIEIPSMLLQPFVENSVKHGMEQKTTAGKIMIEFMKQADNLVLTVTDNGAGFDTERKYTGLGLQLSESRLALLNRVYKENRFILVIQSSTNGTKICLTLMDWL
ncbi:Sensor histidine kinase YehU [compost metagenome]